MTSGSGPQAQTITAGRPAWLRFAVSTAERVLAGGEPSPEMRQFGRYLRELRYRNGIALVDLTAALGLPFEQLAMLEQGLLKPSDIEPDSWVRLMRLLEGRDELTLAARDAQADNAPAVDADEAWAAADEGQAEASAPAEVPVQRKTEPAIGVARIKVVGVGGGGSNAVARMFRQRVPGVEYVVVNTDSQHLLHIDIPVKLRIGDRLTRGLGVGGNPEVGREAALESRGQIEDLVAGTDMVFIACGMGGGTGTGSAPVIAEIAKAAGALTIAAVTKPFYFEGRRRMRQAEEGIERLRHHVDTLVIVPNDRLSAVSDEAMTAENAFRLADDVLRQGVQSIAELITVPGEINLDFADVKTVMQGAGPAWMAIGYGRGEDRAVAAAKAAMASPLLDIPVAGATRVLLNIAGGPDLKLREVHRAADYIASMVDPGANIIFGMVTDARMEDEIRVTVIATGLRNNEEMFNEAIANLVQAQEAPEVSEPPVAQQEEPSVEMPGFLRRLGFGRRKPTKD